LWPDRWIVGEQDGESSCPDELHNELALEPEVETIKIREQVGSIGEQFDQQGLRLRAAPEQ
jgi:hypothetical protein